ncbi:hypothetical protein Tco_1210806 [Tanacetum coccineum]
MSRIAPSSDGPLWDDLVLLILYYGHSIPSLGKSGHDLPMDYRRCWTLGLNSSSMRILTSRSLVFSSVVNADEMTTGSLLSSLRKAYSRCSGLSLEIPNLRKTECGMRLILALKLAKAFFTARGPMRHSSVKLLGSPSF